MGYLRSRDANKELRHATLRSHVQLFRDFGGDGVRSPTLTTTINALCEVRNDLWNPHIPEMIAGYARDLDHRAGRSLERTTFSGPCVHGGW